MSRDSAEITESGWKALQIAQKVLEQIELGNGQKNIALGSLNTRLVTWETEEIGDRQDILQKRMKVKFLLYSPDEKFGLNVGMILRKAPMELDWHAFKIEWGTTRSNPEGRQPRGTAKVHETGGVAIQELY